jgi:hypothetical protein
MRGFQPRSLYVEEATICNMVKIFPKGTLGMARPVVTLIFVGLTVGHGVGYIAWFYVKISSTLTAMKAHFSYPYANLTSRPPRKVMLKKTKTRAIKNIWI